MMYRTRRLYDIYKIYMMNPSAVAVYTAVLAVIAARVKGIGDVIKHGLRRQRLVLLYSTVLQHQHLYSPVSMNSLIFPVDRIFESFANVACLS